MEANFLLDTDICIYVRQKRSEKLLQRFHQLQPNEAAVSVITFGELLYGAVKRGRMAAEREKWAELVHLLPVLPLPEGASRNMELFARIWRPKGESLGTMICGS